MSSLVPYLTFHHGTRSRDFLTEGLGFEVVTEQPGEDGEIVHCELRRGDAVVMGGSGDVTASAAPGLYLVVEEVPDLYASLLERGATEVYGPEQTEWGTWRARFTDLDGHEWTIGTYQPGQSWSSLLGR
ncbi:MAG: VOC family protein [Actinomycetota bacterium]